MFIKFRETRQLLRGNRKELVQFLADSVHKMEQDMGHFVHEGSAVTVEPVVEVAEDEVAQKTPAKAKRS
jgi:hypothetical protein